MNREELPRIRLKVATNAGINILCTALRTWKVIEWLPHIEQAYREVKEDQEGDQDSKKRFIKAIRIKKGNFYIANSELIGDIFEDNDEVQCEIALTVTDKKKGKKEKKAEKMETKMKRDDQIDENDELHKGQEKEKELQENHKEKNGPDSNKKGKKKHKHEQSEEKAQPVIAKKTQHKIHEESLGNTHPADEVHSQKEGESNNLRSSLIKKVDFSKLKALIEPKTLSKQQKVYQKDDNSLSSQQQ